MFLVFRKLRKDVLPLMVIYLGVVEARDLSFLKRSRDGPVGEQKMAFEVASGSARHSFKAVPPTPSEAPRPVPSMMASCPRDLAGLCP